MAFLLSITIFFYYWMVGLSITRVFNFNLTKSINILLSPAIGLSAILLPIFYVNRLGVPVKDFAIQIFIFFLVFSLIVLYFNRPAICAKRFGLLIILWAIVLLFASWPLLWFGFDWLGVANDDMANYCLAAKRFYNQGFFDLPNIDQIKRGENYSQAFWFMHVAGGARPGSELLLAWLWGVTGIEATRIFMPTISSLHLVLASATAALAVSVSRSKKVWIYSILVFAINPLSIWGVGQQLIGQVGGFALMVAAVTVIYQKVRLSKRVYKMLGELVPTVLLTAAMMIWYPESLPFVVGGWVLMMVVKVYFKQSITENAWPLVLVGIVFLIMPIYFISAIKFVLMQSASVGVAVEGDPTGLLFPYYLIPSGIIAFWGMIPVHLGSPSEPFATTLFLAAFLLSVLFLRCLIFGFVERNPAAMVLMVMLILAARLYYSSNDFGLYKLAMYSQPFLIALMVPALLDSKTKYRKILKVIILLLGVAQINTALAYAYRATGEAPGSSVEIQNGSSRSILSKLKYFFDVTIRDERFENRPIISNTDNVVLAKLIAFYGSEHRIIYPSRDFFGGIVSFKDTPRLYSERTIEAEIAESKNYFGRNVTFGGQSVMFFEPEKLNKLYSHERPLFLSTCNTSIISESCSGFIKLSENFTGAIFVHSNIGAHYYSGNRKNASFFQNETDLYPPGVFSSLGRYMLLQFPSTSPDAFFVVDISATLQKSRGSTLPTVIISGGNKKEFIHFVGRGSGRIFSKKVPSTVVDGINYALVDMNVVPETFPNKKTLISYLYGRDVLIDMRRIAVFGRGLHIISRQAYDDLSPPSELTNFPLDLKNPALEYSGIYEDGWVSEESFFVLSPKETSKFVTVAGVVPQIDGVSFSTVLRLSVNGNEIGTKVLNVGNFDFKVPVTSRLAKQQIQLSFTNFQKLPGADGRVAPAKINFIGFE